MKKIRHFNEIKTLPIPDDIKAKLLDHLIEPFGDEATTNAFWQDVGTILYLIEHADTDALLASESEEDQHFLRFVMNYPEWVFVLSDETCPWILAVAIITMEGAGVYLLAPSTSPTQLVNRLSTKAVDSI